MTTLTTTIPDDATGKIKRNAEIAYKSISTYVVLLASAAAAYWFYMAPADQQAFIAAHPVLAPISPYLTFATWLVAKLVPQNLTLSGDAQARVETLFNWFMSEIKARQAIGAPGVVVPPVALTATMKPAEVKQATDAVNAALAPTLPVDPPVMPQSDRVLTNLASVVLDPWENLRLGNPGKSDAEILAIVQATMKAPTP